MLALYLFGVLLLAALFGDILEGGDGPGPLELAFALAWAVPVLVILARWALRKRKSKGRTNEAAD